MFSKKRQRQLFEKQVELCSFCRKVLIENGMNDSWAEILNFVLIRSEK
jgi:hypothetical protein